MFTEPKSTELFNTSVDVLPCQLLNSGIFFFWTAANRLHMWSKTRLCLALTWISVENRPAPATGQGLTLTQAPTPQKILENDLTHQFWHSSPVNWRSEWITGRMFGKVKYCSYTSRSMILSLWGNVTNYFLLSQHFSHDFVNFVLGDSLRSIPFHVAKLYIYWKIIIMPLLCPDSYILVLKFIVIWSFSSLSAPVYLQVRMR